MELEEDLKIQYDSLESEISKFRKWAIFLAFVAFIPFPIAAIFNFIIFDSFLTLADFGGYVGGVASPFGAISGILFVYVAFLGQRQQLLFTQQEIRINQIELRETREEIKGQKEQLELQNKQFQIQSFDSTFFKLIDYYSDQIDKNFPSNTQSVRANFKLFGEKLQKFSSKDYSEKETRVEILNNRGDYFNSYFDKYKDQIELIMRCVYSITAHIHSNRELIDIKYYHNLFYGVLSKTEINLIFYGFLSTSGIYTPIHERILAQFLRNFEASRLFATTDKSLLQEIPEPE
ncbi:hypothetical protein [Algoriphagus aquimarinus]|uniref:Phage abortive infection protein n=1 Tax=Algoriphagus aquimarinus TaxID=237018 RepID=A0A1I0ZK71_9BACT|nr:hypothetical protein [Algoriphagus aquimarinus]SFB25516.1 hypothetical protein SAMN04489723_106126 [Algoriphagus aquimarinus]